MDNLLNLIEQTNIVNTRDEDYQKVLSTCLAFLRYSLDRFKKYANDKDTTNLEILLMRYKPNIFNNNSITNIDKILEKCYETLNDDINCNIVNFNFNLENCYKYSPEIDMFFIEHNFNNLFFKLSYLFYEDGYFKTIPNDESLNKLTMFIIILLIYEKKSSNCLKLLANTMFQNFEMLVKINGTNMINKSFINKLFETIEILRHKIETDFPVRINEYASSIDSSKAMDLIAADYTIIYNIHSKYMQSSHNDYCKKLSLSYNVTINDFYSLLSQPENDNIQVNDMNRKLFKNNDVLNIYVYMQCYKQIFINYCKTQ